MVVPPVDLVVPPGPGGVRDAGAEPGRELAHQVIVQAVLQRAQDDDGAGELEVDLLGRVGKSGSVLKLKSKHTVHTCTGSYVNTAIAPPTPLSRPLKSRDREY